MSEAKRLHRIVRFLFFFMASEELYGISEQPAPTCPKVDLVIRSMRKALAALNGWKRMDEDELRSACDYAEWHISNAEGEIDEVRFHAAKIRAWGQGWKDLAKEHAPKPEQVAT